MSATLSQHSHSVRTHHLNKHQKLCVMQLVRLKQFAANGPTLERRHKELKSSVDLAWDKIGSTAVPESVNAAIERNSVLLEGKIEALRDDAFNKVSTRSAVHNRTQLPT
eukprot:TRINITY_DN68173_c0_g1_i10.p4 TRINITY_DN68173_c0_g1~~TRINITY_DN68173_c0_g1_i10.p4  ORF type:complete len:109 (-),score=15.43 TRINITY_DN68173_c0_g1_i10:1373-1699(-)